MIFLKRLQEKPEKYNKGGITIFSVLSMILVASMLVVLLEGCRFQEIKRLSQLQTELALEGVFANYNVDLWKEYHLLGASLNDEEEILKQIGNGRVSEEKDGANLLEAEVKNVDILSYTLLTDGEGSAYIKTVSSYMEKYLLYETAKKIYNQYEVVKDIADTSQWDWSRIDEAFESIQDSHNMEKKVSNRKFVEYDAVNISRTKEESPFKYNFLESIKRIKNTGILELVIEDTSKLSAASVSMSEMVSRRDLKKGKNFVEQKSEWVDVLYLQQYLINHMSNYCEKKEDRYLTYELEYIIGGKDNDIENLQTVVTKLLTIRGMTNFLYLTTDIKKANEAGAAALLLVGLSANPVLIEAVKVAILTVWAFAESVLDVRAILEGRKISLLKSEDSWTLDWEDIGSITDGYAMAKESTWGLSYEDYLGILLLFENESGMAYRAMDMQEVGIQKKTEDMNFKIDEIIVFSEIEIKYEYKPLFFSFYVLDTEIPLDYQINTSTTYGYY